MSSNEKALKSGLIHAVATMINAGLIFITTPFFTRIMEKGEYGDYNNFLAWYNILSVLSLNLYASFISARRDFSKEYNSYVKSMCCLNFIVLGFWLIISLVSGRFFANIFGLELYYLVFIFVYITFYQVFMMYQVNERFAYRYRKPSFLTIGCAVATAVLSMILVVVMKNQLLGRVIGLVIPTVIVGVMSLIVICREKGKIKISHWLYAIPICIPYIPHLLSLTVLNSVDKTMITSMIGNEESAIYSVAYTCGSIISLVVGVLNNAYVPWMTNKFDVGETEEIKKFSKWYILIFQVILIGVMFGVPEIVYILGGNEYKAAIQLVPVILVGCSMQLVYTMYVNVEQYCKKTQYMAMISVVAAGLNIVLNYIYIPIYGYKAAAYTTLICYFVLAIGHIGISKLLDIRVYSNKLCMGVILTEVILVPLFLWIYNESNIRIISFCIYVIGIIFIMVLKRREIKKLYKWIRKC